MNTTNIKFELDANKTKLIENRVNLEFSRNPLLLYEIDRRLSVVAQQAANDAGTHPASATPGSPDQARSYLFGARTAALPLGATIDSAESRARNGSFLFESFTQVAQLVNVWSAGNEGTKNEVYRSVMEKVQGLVKAKKEAYETKNNEISKQVDDTFTALNAENTEIVRLSALLAAVGGGTVVFPTAQLNAYQDVLNLSKDQLTGTAPIPALGLTLSTPADIVTLTTELNNRFNAFIAATSVARYPATDPNLLAIINRRISGINNSLSSLSSTYSAKLTDHNNRTLLSGGVTFAEAIEEINNRSTLLNEYHDNLEHPVNEDILSEDDRFKNVFIEETPSIHGLPFTLSSPRLGGVPSTPFVKGNAFTEDEYYAFFKWARKNESTLTPEQKEAVDACAQSVTGPRLETQYQHILNAMRAAGGGANATPAQILATASDVVNNFITGTIPGIPATNNMGTGTQTKIYLALLANHFKLDIKNTDSDLKSAVSTKLEEEFVSRFNLPSDAEQKVILDENKKAYAMVEGGRNALTTLIKLRSRKKTRANYLASTQANIYNEIKAKYANEDLSKQDVRARFTADMIKSVMQARLDITNDIMEAQKHSLLTRLSEKITQIPGASFAINAALLGASVAAGAYLNPGFFMPAVDTVKTGAEWAWNGARALIAGAGGWGSTLVKGGGILAAGALGYRVANSAANGLTDHGPWNAARQRRRESIMGTTNMLGENSGGLGKIDRTATNIQDIYKGKAVQRALASQLTLASKYKANIAKTDSDKLDLINSPTFKKKFSTSNDLWEREKQGLSAVINKQISTELTGPAEGRTNRVIMESLKHIYGPNGTEHSFLRAIEKSRSNRGMLGVPKFAGSVAAGAGLGALFAVTF